MSEEVERTNAERQRPQADAGEAAESSAESLPHELFELQAERTPERIAVKSGLRALSYAELDACSNSVACMLRARGVGRGQRVGLCVERGVDMLVAMLGILKSGAAYVPLDPDFPRERLRFMVDDAQLALLISTSSLVHVLGLPDERLLLLGSEATTPALGSVRLPADSHLAPRPEDPAYVIYTSGSTGRPKGVIVPHSAVANFLLSMAREPGLGARDVLVAVTTLSFDIAVLELQLPLVVGATVVIARREEVVNGRALTRLLAEHGATVMQATPVTWRLIIESGWMGGKGFKALVGGEALPKVLAGQLLARGVELWNMYGPTETTVWSTCAHVTNISDGITIGKPIANTTVHILDARNNPCVPGEAGELYIGGAGVTLGYWKRPELTAERFIPDPFSSTPGARLYRTGDLGRLRSDGRIECLGRLDFQVKLRGHRVELGEVEAAIARHPAIRDTVVVAREDTPGSPRLVAYFVAHAPPQDLVNQLRTKLRSMLPEYMVPSAYVPLDALPLTPNSKVDRKALPAPRASHSGSGTYVAPRNDFEIALARAWERVLGIPHVGIADNFFELGGNSISALELIVEMEQATGIEMDLGEIFRSSTIAEFVDSMGSGAARRASVVVPLQAEGDGLPIFCICGINIYKDFAKSLGEAQPVFGVYVEEEQAIVSSAIRGERQSVSVERLVESYYRAISRFQSRGPYRLAGLSFGGILAMELASKLRARGEEVDVVFLFDAVLPQALRRNWYKWLRHQVVEILNGNGATKVRKFLSRAGGALAGATGHSALRDERIYTDALFSIRREAAFIQAAEEWNPRELDIDFRVILFRASDRSMWGPYTDIEEDYGWRRYLGDQLSVVDVIGGHRGIIEPPNVTQLGRKACQFLEPDSQKRYRTTSHAAANEEEGSSARNRVEIPGTRDERAREPRLRKGR